MLGHFFEEGGELGGVGGEQGVAVAESVEGGDLPGELYFREHMKC